jgi:ribonuclease J
MTEITFFGGVDGEIGGNIIQLKTKESRIFLDMGINFQRRRKYYDDIFIKPSSKDELIRVGVLPNLDIFQLTNKTFCDGVLISHAHSDHYKFISFLNRDIPVYLSAESAGIISSISQTLPKTFENDFSGLNFKPFKNLKSFKINDIEIVPIEVNHSIIGAYSFLIYTDNLHIYYTGDFKINGRRKELFQQLIHRLKEEKVDILITEATRVIDFSLTSESDVEKNLQEVLSKGKSLTFIDVSLLDLDRINTIFEISTFLKKDVIIPPRLAYYLLSLREKLGFKPSTHQKLLIYDSGKPQKEEWIKETFSSYPRSNIILKNEILKEPARYIFVNTFLSPAELKELEPPEGSIFIHSSSEPFDEERELSYTRLVNWLEFFGIPSCHIHSSGHIDIFSLRDFVREIKPKITIPIHTAYPYLVGKFFSNISKVIVPKKEVPYTFQ